jgi:hypothetical protein
LDDQPSLKELVVREIVEKHQEIQGLIQNGFSAVAEIGSISDPL